MEGKKGGSLANSIGGLGGRGRGKYKGGVEHNKKKLSNVVRAQKRRTKLPYISNKIEKKRGIVVIRCCLFLKNSRIETLCVVPRKKNREKIIQNCTKEER